MGGPGCMCPKFGGRYEGVISGEGRCCAGGLLMDGRWLEGTGGLPMDRCWLKGTRGLKSALIGGSVILQCSPV